jgi:hypothetical protein
MAEKRLAVCIMGTRYCGISDVHPTNIYLPKSLKSDYTIFGMVVFTTISFSMWGYIYKAYPKYTQGVFVYEFIKALKAKAQQSTTLFHVMRIF